MAKLCIRSQKSLSEIFTDLIGYNTKESAIKNRLNEIGEILVDLKNKILTRSKLVATTLTQSYISKELDIINFDIIIVDEVSMAPMPMLYWAATKAKKGITLVGDFKQLPPICSSNDPLSKKWLGRSIFDELNIETIINKKGNRINLLKYQYRMHPDISEIINKHVYDNRLEDDKTVKNTFKTDSVSDKSAVCLINTSSHNPWCSQFGKGGRFNLLSALICVSLAEKISKDYSNDETIGIITPYRHQARLIQKMVEDTITLKNNKITVDTVHSFQGGQETAVIFDSVEGEGSKKWSMINEFHNKEDAKKLLNVAFSRAEKKLYVIANGKYIKATFDKHTFFVKALLHIINKGKVIESTQIIPGLKDEKFDYWASKLNSIDDLPENFALQYGDNEFWPSFGRDLRGAKSELIIFSPYLTSNRLSKHHLLFSQLISKGIKILVITLDPKDPSQLDGADRVVSKLKEMNIKVVFREKTHEKIAIIDRKILWNGSLNILSHNDKKESMLRVEVENTCKELIKKYNIDILLK